MLKLNKKSYKILMTLIMTVMIISSILPVFAAIKDPSTLSGKEVTSFDNLLGTILGAVQAIGSFAAIIVLVVIGVKYMMGSAEEKAEYKKTMIPYIVGALLVFASSNIVKIVYNLKDQIA